MKFDRRELLTLVGAGALTGIASPLRAGNGPFAVHRPEPGLVEAHLTAAPTRHTVAGRDAELWTYGGGFPGPELRLRAGETLRLHFHNDLPEVTNLHFHGLHIPPTGRADNIWIDIPPGESFRYEFEIPESETGTFWYHPHAHGRIARQMWRGLSGPLVVEGGIDDMPELRAADDRTIFLRDIEFMGDVPTRHWPNDWSHGKEGRLVLCNGQSAPTIQARASLVRLRLINASNAHYMRVGRADGRPLHVISTDGRTLAKTRTAEDVLLTPAQRMDVLVEMPKDTEVELLHLPYDRRSPHLSRRQTLATLRPPEEHLSIPVPEMLQSFAAPDPARAVRRRFISMAMFLLNGQPYNPDRIDQVGRGGDIEIWKVSNVGTMDHPFHMHTWYFQPLTMNGQPWPYSCWRDTVNLTPGDTVELLVPLSHYTGKTVYHCHIAEHGDKGMMGILDVRDA
ncbi:multicopper oxidase family protein [Ferruginivarius sediminum]|uniref:Multicopper oxidase family protein n=1 Tax=Ferruginivarius sediminum TaxID=2661937 RepID=A0A369T5C2_9PROT|nr:multicopper oxidase family protein [Ferruginivarius sediminum]RDD60531.1 multicopper oxidase family protein [Ferruginivarius sediminum]